MRFREVEPPKVCSHAKCYISDSGVRIISGIEPILKNGGMGMHVSVTHASGRIATDEECMAALIHVKPPKKMEEEHSTRTCRHFWETDATP